MSKINEVNQELKHRALAEQIQERRKVVSAYENGVRRTISTWY